MIFGTLQHCFVLNTSVNSILNKFPVVTPSDKINKSVFQLKNQARPLHSNASDSVEPFFCFLAQSKCHKKLTSWTSLYHLKICLISLLFSCKMHLRFEVTIQWCFMLMRPSVRSWWSLQNKLPTSTMLAAV